MQHFPFPFVTFIKSRVRSHYNYNYIHIERYLAYGKQMEREHPPASGTRPYLCCALAMTYSALRDWRFSLINHTLSQLQRDIDQLADIMLLLSSRENCIMQLVACRMRCPMVPWDGTGRTEKTERDLPVPLPFFVQSH